MRTRVHIGESQHFVLTRAVLIYRGRGHRDAFATVHDVRHVDVGAPQLLAGELVTMSFLDKLARGLGSRLAPEVLPPNVLCRTPHVIAWWTPAHVRTLFWYERSEMKALNGKKFPIPPLVWRLSGAQMHVRALDASERPNAETRLFVAPFWNTNMKGLVCQGTMARPADVSVATLDQWVDGYFGSDFTHDFGNRRLTKHPKGFKALWRSLANRSIAFPVQHLVPAKQTLSQFVQGEDASDPTEAD